MLDERKKYSYRCGLILIGVTIFVYLGKYMINISGNVNVDNKITLYTGLIFIILGVIYTFMERKMNLPFYYSINQHGDVNSYVILGIGIALITNTWVSMLIVAVVFAVLAVGIRYFFTPHDEK
ncbi:hypothetical protein EXD82_07290 [Peptacetobacter hominis]|uniref:Transporter n=1 Tax=Peptacetobacter hominis TaxID=2743610 RepID=A0A544QU96_9FIRM|nr:hypothetical protein [Peptacetobacter hominis]TQQ84279.1 hypothetical protein EXD82_07290 [Peptacetobacter hominis]